MGNWLRIIWRGFPSLGVQKKLPKSLNQTISVEKKTWSHDDLRQLYKKWEVYFTGPGFWSGSRGVADIALAGRLGHVKSQKWWCRDMSRIFWRILKTGISGWWVQIFEYIWTDGQRMHFEYDWYYFRITSCISCYTQLVAYKYVVSVLYPPISIFQMQSGTNGVKSFFRFYIVQFIFAYSKGPRACLAL